MTMNFGFNLKETKSRPQPKPNHLYDILILGGGPSGMNAALYAARKGRSVALITKRIGGQLLNTNAIENVIGHHTLTGEELTDKYLTHLDEVDVPVLEDAEATSIEKTDSGFKVTLKDQSVYLGKTLITTLGSTPRKLNIPGELEYANRGVAYCAICDAPLYKGKDVLLAGGGNSAVQAALDVAMVANSVTLINRSQRRADAILIDRIKANPKITVFLETQILEVIGTQALTGVKVLDKKSQTQRIINGDGLFIEIGHEPNTDLVKDLVQLDDHQEVIIDVKGQTSCLGLYACGDMTNTPYKQIIIAAADGAKAALAANDYLNTH